MLTRWVSCALGCASQLPLLLAECHQGGAWCEPPCHWTSAASLSSLLVHGPFQPVVDYLTVSPSDCSNSPFSPGLSPCSAPSSRGRCPPLFSISLLSISISLCVCCHPSLSICEEEASLCWQSSPNICTDDDNEDDDGDGGSNGRDGGEKTAVFGCV